tara:strand:+ start:500 stop:1213 length:714 start_codon:yes stop_codon:yes gene_type:complete
MNINFFTWIHPSGYKYDYSKILLGDVELDSRFQCFNQINSELAIKKQIDLKELINDVYQAFKHIPFQGIQPLSPYYLTKPGLRIDNSPQREIHTENIDRVQHLVNKYGLVNSAKIYSEEISFKKKLDIPQDYWRSDKNIQESISEWEELIQKIMSLKFSKTSIDKTLEISNVKLTLDNDNIYLTPLTLLSAVDCYSYKRGISICGYCDAPFVQKRTNQEYCSNSCRASASRKRQSKD